MLYASEETGNGLRAWRIDAESGMLSPAQHAFPREVTPTGIRVAHDGKSIFVLDGVMGSIYKVTTDASTGEPGWKTEVARVNEPSSIATIE
jgi:6-phosphogluconolactonase (cycloisomerase 2 family)